ncbi:MAG TPA: aminomethyl-transferring glycine dehydrogenase, partial [Saprospiraceae bacterium]|nr:aminomethyl-transferring glycine dehydrogenase [Saprospiraceae bacterium]
MSNSQNFEQRHIGPNPSQTKEMLDVLGLNSIDELIDQTIPKGIRLDSELDVCQSMSESDYLRHIAEVGGLNKVYKSYIGQGYYGTLTPSVILRNIFHNPGWYTQYTPYQAEIAQGRLESLLNFQTMVSDLTGLPIANASLLDEGTAAAEAVTMFEAIRNKKRKNNPANKVFADQYLFEQTISVLKTRTSAIGLELVVGDWKSFDFSDDYICALIQYPDALGEIQDYRNFTEKCKEKDILVGVCADILSLALLVPPGEWGADAVVGSTQRFGIPMGYGGPHAAYFATHEEHKRIIPGRIIGVSVDAQGNRALRMALQTREQHIKREKATSNICTAQALLANMAAMYALYHGEEGIKAIATEIADKTTAIKNYLASNGIATINEKAFDTLSFKLDASEKEKLKAIMEQHEINLFYGRNGVVVMSLDESVDAEDFQKLLNAFDQYFGKNSHQVFPNGTSSIPNSLKRNSNFFEHEVFTKYRSETNMMRYIKKLENKDLSLMHSMISLGSCTMKLNAATELIPVSYREFADMHPFVPNDQAKGYHFIFDKLEEFLCEITSFSACSLQPNSGAQGEYTGLLTIKAYHEHHGDFHRNIALIPASAHGTNPASAVMTGMQVVVVSCDEKGNVDLEDLRLKAEHHRDNLACMMITYPSTHGVFESRIKLMCQIVHDHGGLVYMDGANMNAQVGYTSPGSIGADVCHLNLHKTFAIPHGGGGPGMGPICVNDKLKPFLPGHPIKHVGGSEGIQAVSAAPWGSASILLISYAYIKMLGSAGLKEATNYAILNANYMKARLENDYEILYVGEEGRVAHEFILDLRPFKSLISAEDVAKRLIDYGFHAPTLSFPV